MKFKVLTEEVSLDNIISDPELYNQYAGKYFQGIYIPAYDKKSGLPILPNDWKEGWE